MNELGRRLRRARKEIGLTQSDIAAKARVSLATLQNIEAGRANPTHQTMTRIMDVLGLYLDVGSRAPDWDLLCALGLPLSATTRKRSTRAGPRLLLRHLGRAAREAHRQEPRKREAVQALLLALHNHFPTFYRKHIARSPMIDSLLPDRPSGRIVKLARVATAALAEYL